MNCQRGLEKIAWIGSLEARNEEEARQKAIEQYNIKSADRFTISVKRE
jgi:hypothetical protein